MTDESQQAREFRAEAARGRTGLLREFWDFLRDNKKWWLLPILVMALLIGTLVILGNTGAGAFIYALF
jgi:hypothetical protein